MKKDYKTTIGMEVHAQLNTLTKLFSNSPNIALQQQPNSIVSPIDAAHPGTLPALNHEAVKKVIQVGLAIGADIAEYSEWDRKNYFYPDIPKAYQISQYKYPLVTGGSIAGFAITRIHLEEDTGKSLHTEGDYSLVDLNRAGMPLMELVTEPVIHSAEEAVQFAKELQLLLRYLGVGDANLEKGEMRLEANISVSATDELGLRTEVKNLNSFKSLEKAIDFEVARQIKLIESGKEVSQETRGWDEEKEITFTQRVKEDAHDYRYFPDPDIPKLYVSEVFDLSELKASLPELPAQRHNRLVSLGLSQQQIDLLLARNNLYLYSLDVIDKCSKDIDPIKVVNFVTTNYVGLLPTNEGVETDYNKVAPVKLAQILELINTNEISSTGADIILLELTNKPESEVVEIVELKNLKQNNDMFEIQTLAKQLIAEFPDQVIDFKSGNENILKFFIGQGMKRTQGKVNPQILTKVIQDEISK